MACFPAGLAEGTKKGGHFPPPLNIFYQWASSTAPPMYIIVRIMKTMV